MGSNKDLLIIGSTLASGGVSPETGMRVVSQASIEKMLYDWTTALNVTESFKNDKIVKRMDHMFEISSGIYPFGVVQGYGMGIWRVKGWRTRGRGSKTPVQGWVAMGGAEALMYFDEDGLVVEMCAQKRVKEVELEFAFALAVKEAGNRMDAAFEVGTSTVDDRHSNEQSNVAEE